MLPWSPRPESTRLITEASDALVQLIPAQGLSGRALPLMVTEPPQMGEPPEAFQAPSHRPQPGVAARRSSTAQSAALSPSAQSCGQGSFFYFICFIFVFLRRGFMGPAQG